MGTVTGAGKIRRQIRKMKDQGRQWELQRPEDYPPHWAQTPPKSTPTRPPYEYCGGGGNSAERDAVELAHVMPLPLTLRSTLSPKDGDLGDGLQDGVVDIDG